MVQSHNELHCIRHNKNIVHIKIQKNQEHSIQFQHFKANLNLMWHQLSQLITDVDGHKTCLFPSKEVSTVEFLLVGLCEVNVERLTLVNVRTSIGSHLNYRLL